MTTYVNRPNRLQQVRRSIPDLPNKKHSLFGRLAVLVVVLAVLGGAVYGGMKLTDKVKPAKAASNSSSQKSSGSSSTASSAGSTTSNKTPAPNPCASNTLAQLALVSISQRHMWACNGSTEVYDSAVVTGMENLPADLTPVGTYHITSKVTDTHLIGSDSTGSWNDFVNYWMPFLHNQYGSYGFHDATWRPSDAFGNISPYSSNASHGCVELPLATAKWLYGWAQVGTTVTIEA